MLESIIKGFGLGMILAISVGPVIFTILKQSLNNGQKGGFSFVAGVWFSDILLVFISNMFSTLVMSALEFKSTIGFLGAAFVISLGIYSLFFKKVYFGEDKNVGNIGNEEGFLRAILAGFPDRVAKRRDKNSLKSLMVGNRGVVQSKKSMVRDHGFFVCVDIQSGDEESVARMVSGINGDWLDPVFKRTQREVFYDSSLKKLIAVQKLYYMDLVLDEKDSNLKLYIDVPL